MVSREANVGAVQIAVAGRRTGCDERARNARQTDAHGAAPGNRSTEKPAEIQIPKIHSSQEYRGRPFHAIGVRCGFYCWTIARCSLQYCRQVTN